MATRCKHGMLADQCGVCAKRTARPEVNPKRAKAKKSKKSSGKKSKTKS